MSVNAPSEVAAGGTFVARLDIVGVENLNAASYNVVFDPNVLEVVEIAVGNIGGATMAADPAYWVETPTGSGIYSVLQEIPGLGAVSGSGYLAEVTFRTIGTAGSDSDVDFDHNIGHRVLANVEAEEIPAEWTGASIHVTGP